MNICLNAIMQIFKYRFFIFIILGKYKLSCVNNVQIYCTFYTYVKIKILI